MCKVVILFEGILFFNFFIEMLFGGWMIFVLYDLIIYNLFNWEKIDKLRLFKINK